MPYKINLRNTNSEHEKRAQPTALPSDARRRAYGLAAVFVALSLLGTLALMLLANASAGAEERSPRGETGGRAAAPQAPIMAHRSPPPSPAPFAQIDVSAESVYVYDIAQDRVLFTKRADEQRPLASLTKLVTALVVTTTLSDDMPLAIEEAALATEGDSGLYANEHWRVRDLLNFTLVTSSNDGATQLAAAAGRLLANDAGETTDPQRAFVARMNSTAASLGLSSTYFLNPTGLDLSEAQGGAYGSARDVGRLLAHIVRTDADLLDDTTKGDATFVSQSGFVHEAENTSAPLQHIPGLIGSKTGFTDLAGGNLAVVVDAGLGRPVAIVVMGSTAEARYTDVLKLHSATLAALAG